MMKSNRLIIAAAFCFLFFISVSAYAENETLENSKFELNGKSYEIKHSDVRNGKVVFYTNLYSNIPVSYFKAGDGSQIPLNFKDFVADLSDEKPLNMRRLTSQEGTHEIDPLWADDRSVMYIEKTGDATKPPVYRMVDITSQATREIPEEHYLKAKKRRDFGLYGPELVKTLDVVGDCAWELAFSPDGKYLAGAANVLENGKSINGYAYIWDAHNFNLITRIEKPSVSCNNVVFSPDSRRFLFVESGGAAWMYAPPNFSLIKTVDYLGAAESVVFSPDGRFIAMGEYGCFTILDAQTFKEIEKKRGEGFCYLAFTADGKYLARLSGYYSSQWLVPSNIKIKIFDAKTFKLIHKLKVAARRFQLSPDGQYLICDDEEQALDLWDMTTFKKIKTIKEQRCVTFFTHDSKYLIIVPRPVFLFAAASGKKEYTIKVLDVGTWEVFKTFKISCIGYPDVAALSPDDKYLACADFGAHVYVWDISLLFDNNDQVN
jgi:WD40 repeat protein